MLFPFLNLLYYFCRNACNDNTGRYIFCHDCACRNYGIAADRLNVEAGGGVDKFGQPILNRVVLVKSAN